MYTVYSLEYKCTFYAFAYILAECLHFMYSGMHLLKIYPHGLTFHRTVRPYTARNL